MNNFKIVFTNQFLMTFFHFLVTNFYKTNGCGSVSELLFLIQIRQIIRTNPHNWLQSRLDMNRLQVLEKKIFRGLFIFFVFFAKGKNTRNAFQKLDEGKYLCTSNKPLEGRFYNQSVPVYRNQYRTDYSRNWIFF